MTSFARIMAGIISTTGDVKSTVVGDIGLSVYSTLDSLPTSALTSGGQAFVSENNRIYVSNGSGWYNVALLSATPTLSISPSGAVTLAVDGSTPTVITLAGTDSDNADANLVYSVESDGSFANIATLSQDSSVFTITPLAEGAATPGSSTLTFKVSDGISFGSGTTEFSLTFGPDWSSYSLLQTHNGGGTGSPGEYYGYLSAMNPDATYFYSIFGGSSLTSAMDIWQRAGSSWSKIQTIGTSQWVDEALYGQSGSIAASEDGEWLVVGNLGEDTYGTNAGVAYLYQLSGGTYSFVKDISYVAANSFFGRSVAISRNGNYIAVGGERYDGTYLDQGAVRVYETSNSWSTYTGQTITASNAAANDYYGYSVDFNNDATYMIVGARLHDTAASNSGAAYIYTRSGSTWTEQDILYEPTSSANVYFGWNVKINGDGTVALVHSDIGFHVFTRSGSTWTHQQTLRDSDETLTLSAGKYNILLNDAGDLLVTSSSANETVKVYSYNGSTWVKVNDITDAGITSGYNYGGCIAGDKDITYLVVGEHGNGSAGGSDGKVYFYEAG